MHSEISEKLKAYIDKELSFSERRAIGRHLKICADCASKAKAFEITTNAIKDFKEVEAPSGFTQKVMARLPTAPARPTSEPGSSSHLFTTRLTLHTRLKLTTTLAVIRALVVTAIFFVARPATPSTILGAEIFSNNRKALSKQKDVIIHQMVKMYSPAHKIGKYVLLETWFKIKSRKFSESGSRVIKKRKNEIYAAGSSLSGLMRR